MNAEVCVSVANIDKLLQYLKCVAKEPIKYYGNLDTDSGLRSVDSDGRVVTIVGSDIPISSIKLSSTFFDTDMCLNCGGCDPAESNLFTQSEYDRIQSTEPEVFVNYGLNPDDLKLLQEGLVEVEHNINGKVVKTYSYAQVKNTLYLPIRSKELNRCSWCFQSDSCKFKCKIHPVTSITCVMPHMRFHHMNKSPNTSIGIYQFGRNWALKCPVIFSKPEDERQFELNKANRIDKLSRLKQVSDDLNIETYLPEVIEYAKNVEFDEYETKLDINIIKHAKHQRKLFNLI